MSVKNGLSNKILAIMKDTPYVTMDVISDNLSVTKQTVERTVKN